MKIVNDFHSLAIFGESSSILNFWQGSEYTSAEAATGGVLLEKVFLEILQNSLENTCARVSILIKLQA